MRTRVYFGIISAGFFLLVVMLFYTQIIRGPYYKKRSEENRITIVPLDAPRGKILDKNGNPIVDNRICFDVSIVYRNARDLNKLTSFLAQSLKVNKSDILRNLNKARARPYAQCLLVEDIGRENAVILEEKRYDHPGYNITTRPKRDYLMGPQAASVSGYIGKISELELSKYRQYGYTIRDFVGRAGLERKYDEYLRGTEGGMQIETDSRGRQLEVLGVAPAVHGKSITTTIDKDLQEYCYTIMEERNGAVIVMNPSSGEIYALVSKPSYDPNIFIKSGMNKEIRAVLRNESGMHQLLNRAISASYPPGSVFKIITSLAALTYDKCTLETTFTCGGVFRLGSAAFHCWKEGGHGAQHIREAIKNSCNVFFYNVGVRTGGNYISEFAKKFGLDSKTGIDLPGEISGFVPTPKWKLVTGQGGWSGGDSANMAIGQGALLTTPIEIACMVSAVANHGYLVRPYLVEKIENVKVSSPRVEKINVDKKALDIVREGMYKVVNDPDGTGKKCVLENFKVAGKTGTAQNSKGKAHGWFGSFAPFENPQVSVLVFVEFGGKGGVEASKIAHGIYLKCIEKGILK